MFSLLNEVFLELNLSLHSVQLCGISPWEKNSCIVQKEFSFWVSEKKELVKCWFYFI